KKFESERLDRAVHLLVKEYDGATLGPEVEGCWHSRDGKLRCEPIRLLVVSFEVERLPAFRETLKEVGQLLGHEAIYVRFEEPRVLILQVSPRSVPAP